MSEHKNIDDALSILAQLGLPRAQQNERSALCLLALLNIAPGKKWKQAKNPLIGITPIMDWARENYGKNYAPNTRETVRRQSMHQFVSAGIALYNPDDPERPTNSPNAAYQIEPGALSLLKTFGSRAWASNLADWLTKRQTLSQRYAKARHLERIPVKLGQGKKVELSPGAHSKLIKAIIEEFAPRFAPGSRLIYAGDTGKKWGYFDEALLKSLGVEAIDAHGKMPDVILYRADREWLFLIEAVTSHGPVNAKRQEELARIFNSVKPGLVYVSAFPDGPTYKKYALDIAWDTEIWVADAPTHMIHLNGDKFLGPRG